MSDLNELNSIYDDSPEVITSEEEKSQAEFDREKYLDIQLKFEERMLDLGEKQNNMRIDFANKVLDFMNTARKHVLEENDLVQKTQSEFSSMTSEQLRDQKNWVDDLVAIQKG